MPRVTQLVNVTINETGIKDSKRTWSATIEANALLFLLSDELAKEGAIKELEGSLRAVLGFPPRLVLRGAFGGARSISPPPPGCARTVAP